MCTANLSSKFLNRSDSSSANVAFFSTDNASVSAGKVVAPYPIAPPQSQPHLREETDGIQSRILKEPTHSPSHFPGATPRCLYHSLSLIPLLDINPRSNPISFLLALPTLFAALMNSRIGKRGSAAFTATSSVSTMSWLTSPPSRSRYPAHARATFCARVSASD